MSMSDVELHDMDGSDGDGLYSKFMSMISLRCRDCGTHDLKPVTKISNGNPLIPDKQCSRCAGNSGATAAQTWYLCPNPDCHAYYCTPCRLGQPFPGVVSGDVAPVDDSFLGCNCELRDIARKTGCCGGGGASCSCFIDDICTRGMRYCCIGWTRAWQCMKQACKGCCWEFKFLCIPCCCKNITNPFDGRHEVQKKRKWRELKVKDIVKKRMQEITQSLLILFWDINRIWTLAISDNPKWAWLMLSIMAFRMSITFLIFMFYYTWEWSNWLYLLGIGIPVDSIRALGEINYKFGPGFEIGANVVSKNNGLGGTEGKVKLSTWKINVRLEEAFWLKRFLETGPILMIYLYIAARDSMGEPITDDTFDWSWDNWEGGLVTLVVTVGRCVMLAFCLGNITAIGIPKWKGDEQIDGTGTGPFQCVPSNHSNRAVRMMLIVLADFGMRVLPLIIWLALASPSEAKPYGVWTPWREYEIDNRLSLAILVFFLVWVGEAILVTFQLDWNPQYIPFVAFVQGFSGILTFTSNSAMRDGMNQSVCPEGHLMDKVFHGENSGITGIHVDEDSICISRTTVQCSLNDGKLYPREEVFICTTCDEDNVRCVNCDAVDGKKSVYYCKTFKMAVVLMVRFGVSLALLFSVLQHFGELGNGSVDSLWFMSALVCMLAAAAQYPIIPPHIRPISELFIREGANDKCCWSSKDTSRSCWSDPSSCCAKVFGGCLVEVYAKHEMMDDDDIEHSDGVIRTDRSDGNGLRQSQHERNIGYQEADRDSDYNEHGHEWQKYEMVCCCCLSCRGWEKRRRSEFDGGIDTMRDSDGLSIIGLRSSNL